MLSDSNIIDRLNRNLSSAFKDYRGAYFFGSRLTGKHNEESDYDVVLIFDELDREKRLEIAGIISLIEYETNVFIDCKYLTTSGKKSIDYIRENVNPLFIRAAIDNGKFFARL